MIKPVIGSIVKLFARDLKAGMKMIEDGETVEILEVEIDICEENAVSYIYRDPAGKDWAGYGRIDSVKSVEYAAGINLIDIIE
jgi:hypothetical protein